MSARPVILLLESEVIARHSLAEYLRECGYRVVEAATTDEARAYIEEGDAAVDVALLDATASGSLGAFTLARSLREQQPQIDIVMAGALEAAANKASELCENGPLGKPYDHLQVVDYIKRVRAKRQRK